MACKNTGRCLKHSEPVEGHCVVCVVCGELIKIKFAGDHEGNLGMTDKESQDSDDLEISDILAGAD